MTLPMKRFEEVLGSKMIGLTSCKMTLIDIYILVNPLYIPIYNPIR